MNTLFFLCFWEIFFPLLLFPPLCLACTTIGILALGFDLLCRNFETFLNSTKLLNIRKSLDTERISKFGRITRNSYWQTSQSTVRRRLISWQLQHELEWHYNNYNRKIDHMYCGKCQNISLHYLYPLLSWIYLKKPYW